MDPNLFEKVIELLDDYQQKSLLSHEQKYVVSEIVSRLKFSSTKYISIIETSRALLKKDSRIIESRELLSDESINKIMQEQAKQDPELAKFLSSMGGRLIRKQSTEISTYDMGGLNTTPDPNIEEIKRLLSETESIYHNLWAIKMRLNQLSEFKNFTPKGVTFVRNHLIEHIEKPNSRAYIFSFGITPGGPVLRPVRPSEAKAPRDRGLTANVEEFLSEIVKQLQMKAEFNG